MNSTIQEIKSEILKADQILISTHVLPDGDGLGAEIALFHYLKQGKIPCKILNPDPVPKRYQFLDPKQKILRHLGQVLNKKQIGKNAVWIVLDTHDPRRLGKLWKQMAGKFNKIYFLDHHPQISSKHDLKYPDQCRILSDPKSSSIGELLYRLFSKLSFGSISPNVALGLYVSVMTDTNSFRHATTTPLAHQIAAEMIQKKINPEKIYQAIYSSKEISHIRLLGILLQDIRVTSGGRIAWLELPLALRKKFQATPDDTLSFLSLLMMIRNAEIICLFREEEDGKVRVSIKSKGRFVVNQVATHLGGGGHDYAAGLALSQPLDKTVQIVIKNLKTLLPKKEYLRKNK